MNVDYANKEEETFTVDEEWKRKIKEEDMSLFDSSAANQDWIQEAQLEEGGPNCHLYESSERVENECIVTLAQEGIFPCSVCPQSFRNEQSDDEHKKEHT